MSKTSRKDLSTVVEGVAVVSRRRRRGTLLIALGLIAAAGAVALVVSGKKQTGSRDAVAAAGTELPPVERRDALAAEEETAGSSDTGQAGVARPANAAPATDDTVGDAEQKIDNALAGKPTLPEQPEGQRRGRHAAQE